MNFKTVGVPVFYGVVSLLVLLTATLRPFYNWDFIPYLGCAKEFQTSNPTDVHAFAYGAIESKRAEGDRLFPASELDSSNAFRIWMANDAQSFSNHLGFYRVRVGYTGAIFLLAQAGVPPIFATHFISALSIFLSIWLLFLIGRGRLATPLRYALLPLGLSLGMMESARLSTPDGLAFLLIMVAVWLYLRESNVLFLLLPLLVLVRTDLAIFSVLFAGTFFLQKPAKRLLPLLSIASSIGVALFLQSHYQYPGWAALMYVTFIDKMTFQAPQEFGVLQYIRAVAKGGWDLLRTSEFLFFTVVGGLATYLATRIFKGRSLSEMAMSKPLILLAISLACILVRFALYPQPDTRYVAGFYVSAAIALFAFISSENGRVTGNSTLTSS